MENYLRYSSFINDVSSALDDDLDDVHDDVKESTQKYVQCMRDNDYEVADLGDAGTLAQQKFGHYRKPNGDPSAEEAEMARADLRCQQDSGLFTNEGVVG